jgi:hypothetical protein
MADFTSKYGYAERRQALSIARSGDSLRGSVVQELMKPVAASGGEHPLRALYRTTHSLPPRHAVAHARFERVRSRSVDQHVVAGR